MCGTLLVIIHLYEVTGWLSATLQDDGQAVWFTCHYYNPVTWALLWRGSINVLIVDSTCHYYNPVTWALLWRGSPVTITIQLPGLLWRGSINVLIVDSIKALCPEKLFSGKSQT